ncbi:MAG TPA: type II and III secretion system protein [Candidatus Xenobia bacterium]|nr:type II and III secretion system protein [Candidatus Xenobia bacterium]
MRVALYRLLAAFLAGAILAPSGVAQTAPARPPAATAPGATPAQPPSPFTPRPVQLQGPAKQVFERLGELYGVRLRVDDQVSQRPIDLRMDKANFVTALRVAAQLSNTIWIPQPDGSFIVAPDTKDARDRYDPALERSYDLPGATPEELAEVVRLLREILDIRDVRPDLRSSTITIRDTATRLAAAERLFPAFVDDPAEIHIEGIIFDLDRDKAQAYGILPPDQVIAVHAGAGALALSSSSTLQDLIENLQFLLQQGVLPSSLVDLITRSLAAGTGFPGFVLVGGGATTYALFLPGAVLNLQHLASSTRSWRRIDLRAREGKEATLFIGDRFPIVTSVYTSAFGFPTTLSGIPPAVQYEQLGLKVTVTPRVHSRDELSFVLKLEDRRVTGQSGQGLAIIGNRTLEQQVRLKEGEPLLLGGMQTHLTENRITGTPGLSALPVIGHLFKRTEPHTQTSELVILLVPHVVRWPARERLAKLVLPVGTEREFSPQGPAPAEAPPPPPITPAPPGVQSPGVQPQPGQPRPQQPRTPQPPQYPQQPQPRPQ